MSRASWMAGTIAWALTAGAGAQEGGAAAGKFPDELLACFPGALEGFEGPRFEQRVRCSAGADSLVRVRRERGERGEAWREAQRPEQAGFTITGAALAAGGDLLFVAGLLADGRAVLERWSADPRPGGWIARVPVPDGAHLGVPLPPARAELSVVGGGEWTAPPGDWSLAPARRERLLTDEAGPFCALDADPQGRYLLLQDLGRGELRQLELGAAPPALHVVARAADHPALALPCQLELFELAGEGRRALLRPLAASARAPHVLLRDVENDGRFEQQRPLTRERWESSPTAERRRWSRPWRE